jgi:RNA polymerase sigma factor (sigma-70 family)
MDGAGVRAVAEAEHALDFEAFFGAEFERLFQTLYLVCGDRAEAEDLAQETMSRLFERWDRVAVAESPVAYLYRSAFNLNHQRLRRLVLRRRTSPRPDQSPPPDPAQVVETRTVMLEVLASLPRAQREALVLVEWLGFSPEEAGQVLGIESVSVRGRLHRARAAVRKRFGGIDE